MSDIALSTATSSTMIDDRIRGFPAGHAALPIDAVGRQGWKPFDGQMSLPLISLDRVAFAHNVALMMRYATAQHVEIAPHAKTPMSTALVRQLIEAGAWGTTVADIRQLSVMLKAGFTRLILANEIGGPAAARRLAALLANHPEAEVFIFVDSVPLVQSLRDAWAARSDLPVLALLVEMGAARAGARSEAEAHAVIDAILAAESGTFRLAGIAAYEGSAATADPTETAARISALMALTADVCHTVRNRVGPERELVVTAGGSVFFDMVLAALKPGLAADPNATLVLRSGAIFFHDHGVYERGMAALDARQGFEIDGKVEHAGAGFRPTLRLWAEILSLPESDLAICGMGLRDVAMDQGLPRPLAIYRDGKPLGTLAGAEVLRLNDQHAFVSLAADTDVAIGDVIEFGISHPCTCLDRHAVLYGLDESRTVEAVLPASFG